MEPSREPRVEAIFITAKTGDPMLRVESVEAVPGAGLKEDRYFRGSGRFSDADECEVTLIEAEALERMETKFGVHVSAGQHRRNIVIRGIGHAELRGHSFRIGGAIFEYDKPRPQCGYLTRITAEPRMTKAMGEGPGFGANIIGAGTLRVGDMIEVLPGPQTRQHRLP